jgi:hypothetical protein
MTDELQDDEILGRALSRAIETQPVRETAYERSRLKEHANRRGWPLGQFAALAAALILIVGIGTWLGRPNAVLSPTTAPSASVGATTSPNATVATSTASPTPLPTPKTAVDHGVVYFARDVYAPVAGSVAGAGVGSTIEERVASRIEKLRDASPVAGTVNAYPGRGIPVVLSGGTAGVKISGDLVTLDFAVPSSDWGVRGAGNARALLQQLVYTATEEPGIRRVTITENGGKPTTIDQLSVDANLGRDDVSGYDVPGSTDVIEDDGGGEGVTAKSSWSVDAAAPGLTRFVLTFSGGNGKVPAFSVGAKTNGEPAFRDGKSVLAVTVTAAGDTGETAIVDRTPLRQIQVSTVPASATLTKERMQYVLQLDDLRPWRVFTLANPARLVVDIGGPVLAVSDRIAVYQPVVGGTIGQTFVLSGAARVFEANVVWRVKDSRLREVAKGNTSASLGTSPVWGTFQTTITLPTTVTGNVTIEVFEVSPRDGSEVGVVSFGAVVR